MAEAAQPGSVAPPLQSFRPRLAALNERLRAWQQQVAETIRAEFARMQKAGELHDAAGQQNAARMALARVGDGPRRELNGAIDELCLLYLKSAEEQRAQIRLLIQEHDVIFHDLWGYLRRAAEQIRAGGGEQWLRMGLAVAAMEDSLGDEVDTSEGLRELFLSAQEQNLDAARIFRESAALASGAPHEGKKFSTRELLKNFAVGS